MSSSTLGNYLADGTGRMLSCFISPRSPPHCSPGAIDEGVDKACQKLPGIAGWASSGPISHGREAHPALPFLFAGIYKLGEKSNEII